VSQRSWEAAIPTSASFDYSESYLPEDAALLAARERGAELGCTPIGSGGGAVLHFLASVIDAKSVVEIGTGAGVSGIWLQRGMNPDGVLTSIDIEPEHQNAARQAYADAGIANHRARLINGRALDVLPRLTDAAYDLVFVDGEKIEYVDYLREAIRLLRPGGIVAFDNSLWHDRVADPSVRDEETLAVRDLITVVRDDERLSSMLLPVGDGLMVASLRVSAGSVDNG
jgi:predicted O-methyltransferase YrrM